MINYKCRGCLKLLSVEKRFDIFNYLLSNKEGVKVNDLVELTGLKQPTVTFHVNKLSRRGLVKKIKQGRDVICFLNIRCTDCPFLVN